MSVDEMLAKLGPDGEGYFGRDAFPVLRSALARAHAEGKAEGRRDDVLFLENEAHEYGLKGLSEEQRAIEQIATTLRSLIPAAPEEDCPHGWAAQTGGHPNDCAVCPTTLLPPEEKK